ncbi:hypothetical protein BJX65DRAFT_313923 [Aspergillus insuetus]
MPYDERWRQLHSIRGTVMNPRIAKAASRYLAFRLVDTDNEKEEGGMSLGERFLHNVPGIVWLSKRRARPFFDELRGLFHARLQAALARPAWNIARTLAKRFPPLPPGKIDNDRPEELSFLVSEIYMAGVGSTPITLDALITMALLHPTELGILRAQLDLLTITPLAVPHALSSSPDDDDEPQIYNGYYIPHDAFIMPFPSAINRDPSVYADPHAFIPQQWLDTDTD